MTPTICSDKKHQTQRSGGISNLRRQARGLQRNNVPTASSIINYVSKGVINPRSIAQLRQRTNSTASNSSENSEIDFNGSATPNKRLQEQHQHQSEHQRRHHQQQQQHHHHHHHQETEATLGSRPQISDSAVSSSLPSPSSSISSSESIVLINNNSTAHNSNNHVNNFRVLSPYNTLSEDSLNPPYQDEDGNSSQLIYDADMEDTDSNNVDNVYDDDAHSIVSDFSDVAIDLSTDDCEHRRQHQSHQTVFNAPAFGDKQQHISVICSTSTRTTTNSNNSNSNTNIINHNNNNNNNTTNYNTNRTISSNLMHSSRDNQYELCEVKNTEGLLSIAIKTIKLVKRNQMLQRRLAQLQQETSEFIQSVMSNPENRNYREKLEQKEQPPLKQQRAD